MDNKENEQLKRDLDALLRKYPQLKKTEIKFSETGADILTAGSSSEQAESPAIPLCKQKSPSPDKLFGLSPKVDVRHSSLHGYGMFAKEVIEAGEMIEECRLLQLADRSRYVTDLALKDYTWANKSCDCIECREYGPTLFLPLGFGSQYNHADQPNTRQQLDFKKQIFVVKARTRIEKDAEIFVTYGDKYFLVRNFWKNIQNTKDLENAMRRKNQAAQKQQGQEG